MLNITAMANSVATDVDNPEFGLVAQVNNKVGNSPLSDRDNISAVKLGSISTKTAIPESLPPKDSEALIIEEPMPLPPKNLTSIEEPIPLPPESDESAELASDDVAMLLEDADLISSPLTLQSNAHYAGNVTASATINLNGGVFYQG